MVVVPVFFEYSFEAERWIFVFMTNFSLFGLLVNLFGLYAIAFCTPSSMRTLGWIMTGYQMLSTTTDFIIGAGIGPVLFLPIFGGITTGWLGKIGVTTIIQLTAAFCLFLHVVALIVAMFLHRYFAILPQNHSLKLGFWNTITFFTVLQVMPYVQFIPLYTYSWSNTDMTENNSAGMTHSCVSAISGVSYVSCRQRSNTTGLYIPRCEPSLAPKASWR
ncbi:unnamed protein product, partial [Mesorhabditis spiculigera]